MALENSFYSDPRVMSYDDLVAANEVAIEKKYNRTINIDHFLETVQNFGYDPRRLKYPVLPLILHEHAQGKKVDPHIRLKIIGPLSEDDALVVEATLDCTFEVFKKLPIFDLEKKKIVLAN